MAVVHLSDIPENFTKEDIEDSFKREMEGAIVLVTSVRPAYGGSLKATVRAGRSLVDLVVRRGTIRIGPVRCRVVERKPDDKRSTKIQDRKCYGCQQLGHIRANYPVEKNRSRRQRSPNQNRGGMAHNSTDTGQPLPTEAPHQDPLITGRKI